MTPADRRRQYGTGSVFQRKSDGRWIGRLEAGWNINGTRRRITVSAKTEAEAKVKLKKKQREIAAEGLPAAGTARATVKSWAGQWLVQHSRSVRPKSYATDASIVARWIIPTIGHRRLEDLTPGDVRALSDEIRKAGRSTTTAKYAHGVLLRLLRAAIAEGHTIPQRVMLTKPPGKATSDRDAIPLSDALALLEVASTRPDGSRWAAAFLQGMRQGECLGLTWAAVDQGRQLLTISWQLQALPYLNRAAGTFLIPDGYEARRLTGALHLVRPKTRNAWRVIPLVPWMATALDQWRRACPASPHDLVWPRADGRPMTDKLDRTAWHQLQDAAQVARVDGTRGRRYLLHEARHTAATLLLELGVDAKVITDILGHSSIVTSRGYMHTSRDQVRLALEGVAHRLGLEAGQ
ncbi:tyrosine-type recombinase/integrase [Segeticoccus rhizosphaerae]|uniref:tyrosine-type recombinase/integrase n=1 Tax=Segeticoccus rhizosphaerae TaxID=1104777 RepID=UPI001264C3B5|nr:site-specific integrase [Segeticoccus rhizosphaerae]